MGKAPDLKLRKRRSVVGGDPDQIMVGERPAALLLGVDRAVLRRWVREGNIFRRSVSTEPGREKSLFMYRDLVLLADSLPITSPNEGSTDD